MKHEALWYSEKGWIRDKAGRARIFRGLNVSSANKIPFTPNAETWNPSSLENPYTVSFTGRPFSEESADEHFNRLLSLGCTLIRWCITWEAVEHSGPGEYDEDYLAYVRRLLKKAEEYGISVFIDPHQDVWSRFTGGDGAPAWTLEKVGFNLDTIELCNAAFTQQGAIKNNKKYMQMSWPLNYQRYACATMFTLFFAGNTFAPNCKIDGENVQDFLQEHYIAAMNHTARRLKDCKAIVGFGTMNEPNAGYIGLNNLAEIQSPMGFAGEVCSPFEGIKAASGFDSEFKKFSIGLKGIKIGSSVFYKNTNENSLPKLFLDGFDCPWKKEGVWHEENGVPVLDKPDYFSVINGNTVCFEQDFLKKFYKNYITSFQKKYSHFLFFVEGQISGELCSWKNDDEEKEKIVNAFHWYDVKTLILKKWIPSVAINSKTLKVSIGKKKTGDSFIEELREFSSKSRKEGIPPLLGEFGVPFDLDNGKSFKTKNYSKQTEALGMYYDALDALLLSGTLWNYTPSNTHSHGDGWNGEDLSVYNSETRELRGVKGFCRPYAMATAGTPVRMSFIEDDIPVFEYEWDSTPCPAASGDADTEIYLPTAWFPKGWKVQKFDGVGVLREVQEQQRLFVKTLEARRCFIRVVGKS